MCRFFGVGIALFVCVGVAACGGGGSSRSSSGSGSSQASTNVQPGQSQSSSVDASSVAYFKFTTTTSQNYAITLSDASAELSWELFSDAARRDSLGYCPGGNCLLPLNANTTYYVSVWNESPAATSFTILVRTTYQQGFLDTPMYIGLGTNIAASVDADGVSFYTFWPQLDGPLSIRLTESNTQIGWALFSDSQFTDLITECADFSEGFDQACTVQVNGQSTYNLLLCEFGGVNGFTTLRVSTNEGSTAQPIAVNLGSARTGGSDPYGSSYYQFTVGYSGSYTVGLFNGTAMFDWYLYDDAGFTSEIARCDDYVGSFSDSGTRNCTVYLAAGTYYLRVENLSGNLATYDLLIPGGLDEGSINAPVPLTVGTARNSTVDALGRSFFTFATAVASEALPYQIAISGSTSARMGWNLYSNSELTEGVWSCGGWFDNEANPACSVSLAPGQVFYLTVDESDGTPSEYALLVSVNEGTIATPQAVTLDARRVSTVDAFGASYYAFTPTLTQNHTIAVTGFAAQMSWKLYSDAQFTNQIASCSHATNGTLPVCAAALSATVPYYLKVQEASGAPQLYNLFISSGAGNQGSMASPVSLPAATFPTVVSTVNATVAPFGESFFSFNTGAPLHTGESTNVYWITAIGLWTDVSWKLYSDAGFSNEIASCNKFFGEDEREQCEAILTPNTVYYLSVAKHNAYFTTLNNVSLSIETRGPPNSGASSGTVESPTNVTFNAFGQSSTTNVAGNGVSYFKFTPTATDSYILSTFGRLSWDLYSNSGFSTLKAACPSAERSGRQSCAAGELTSGTTYYVKVTNDSPLGTVPCCMLELTKVGHDAAMSGPLYLSEGGSTQPVGISLGVGRSSTISPRARSYYTFTTTSPGTYYISTKPTSLGTSVWFLYSDSDFTEQVAQCVHDMTHDANSHTQTAACSVALNASKAYYLAVEFEREGSPVGQTFTLTVSH